MKKTIALAGAIARHATTFDFVAMLLAESEVRVLAVDIDAERNLPAFVNGLIAERRIDGLLGIGEADDADVIGTVLQALPLGFPKMLVSTAAGGDVSRYAGTKDAVMWPSVVSSTELNSVSRRILANAAAAIAGAVMMPGIEKQASKPLIVASMYGNTTPAVRRAKERFEEAGFDVLIFHASGVGGRVMESLIDDGLAAACFDFTTTELIDYVAGGVMSAGPDRLMAAARKGIPTILVPGCVDQIVFHSVEQMPPEYRSRNLYQWNPNVTLMRSNAAECRKVGEMIARAANAHASGQVAILLPLGGTSMLDQAGGPYWDPEANRACFEAIEQQTKPAVRVYAIEAHINDPVFVDKAIAVFFALLERAGVHGEPAAAVAR